MFEVGDFVRTNYRNDDDHKMVVVVRKQNENGNFAYDVVWVMGGSRFASTENWREYELRSVSND